MADKLYNAAHNDELINLVRNSIYDAVESLGAKGEVLWVTSRDIYYDIRGLVMSRAVVDEAEFEDELVAQLRAVAEIGKTKAAKAATDSAVATALGVIRTTVGILRLVAA